MPDERLKQLLLACENDKSEDTRLVAGDYILEFYPEFGIKERARSHSCPDQWFTLAMGYKVIQSTNTIPYPEGGGFTWHRDCEDRQVWLGTLDLFYGGGGFYRRVGRICLWCGHGEEYHNKGKCGQCSCNHFKVAK